MTTVTVSDHLVGVVLRLDTTTGLVVGMQTEMERCYSDGSAVGLPAEPATFTSLAALLHADDRAALIAALEAVP
jgi:hypothetical protein